jgi:protein gp37
MHDDRLSKITSRQKPKTIFVCNIGDLFHESVPDEFICKVFRVMEQAPQHQYLLLTKRSERMQDFLEWSRVREWGSWPNLFLGVTVEGLDQRHRILNLGGNTSTKRWVSLEPLLGRIDISCYLSMLDWVVVGCESGAKRRECKIEWVIDLVKQCKVANVPVWVKQVSIDGKVCHDIKKIEKHYPELAVRERPKFVKNNVKLTRNLTRPNRRKLLIDRQSLEN